MRSLAKRRRKLDSPIALAKLNGALIHQVLEGELAVDVARTAFMGLQLQRQLVEASSMEERLAALESALAEGRLRRIA